MNDLVIASLVFACLAFEMGNRMDYVCLAFAKASLMDCECLAFATAELMVLPLVSPSDYL